MKKHIKTIAFLFIVFFTLYGIGSQANLLGLSCLITPNTSVVFTAFVGFLMCFIVFLAISGLCAIYLVFYDFIND